MERSRSCWRRPWPGFGARIKPVTSTSAPSRRSTALAKKSSLLRDLEFKPTVQGEIKKTNWFQITYIQGLKNQPPRHYDERSFKAVYPFLEKIKLWVDTEKRDGREF